MGRLLQFRFWSIAVHRQRPEERRLPGLSVPRFHTDIYPVTLCVQGNTSRLVGSSSSMPSAWHGMRHRLQSLGTVERLRLSHAVRQSSLCSMAHKASPAGDCATAPWGYKGECGALFHLATSPWSSESCAEHGINLSRSFLCRER